jgi:polyisoprenoid-binding protein YceI
LICSAGSAAGTRQLDPAASPVTFAARHFWGLLTVRGQFDQLDGTADVSQTGSVRGSLTVAAASGDTGNANRDQHLRSAGFFHTAGPGSAPGPAAAFAGTAMRHTTRASAEQRRSGASEPAHDVPAV